MHLETKLSVIVYLLVGLPTLVLYSIITPVFHVPDEPQHFIRAYQVANFEFFPTKKPFENRTGYRVGGMVDIGIIQVDSILTSIAFDSEQRLKPELHKRAERIGWHGERWQHTPNVSIYPPFLYIPSAIGIAVARHNGLSITKSVTLSRWCNLSVGACLAVLAIALSGECAVLLTGFLLLPMALSQMASVSQDALMLPLAALLAAMLAGMIKPLQSSRLFVLSVCSALVIFLLASTRPPYSALGLLLLVLAPLQVTKEKRILLCISGAVAIFLSFLWALYVSSFVAVPFGDKPIDYAGQVNYILSNPLDFLSVLRRSIDQFGGMWRDQMIGVLGWLDTRLPSWYYDFASIGLLFIALLLLPKRWGRGISLKLLLIKFTILLTLIVAAFGLLTVLYIVWSPVGAEIVHGFQGRYLLPLLFLAILLFKGDTTDGSMGRSAKTRLGLMCLVGTVSVVIGIISVFHRFYM